MEEAIRLEGARVVRNGRPVVEAVDWTVRPGERWALYGPNGSGKSSLLALLEGSLQLDEGRAWRAPGLRWGVLRQRPSLPLAGTLADAMHRGLGEVRQLEAALRAEERRMAAGERDLDRYGRLHDAFEAAGGYRAERRLHRELSTLLPDREADTPLAALSSGEVQRLALALTLAPRPDVLLLDEPSNRLDLEGRRWLARRLVRSSAAVVVASHDRALLSRISTHSAEARQGRLRLAALPFDRDREQRGVAQRSRQRRVREAGKEAQRLDAAAGRLATWGTPAARGQRRTVERRRDALAAELREGMEAEDPQPSRLPAVGAAEHAGPVLWAQGLVAPPAIVEASLRLEAGEKIALLGPNGSGKSTLLRLLAREMPSADPRGSVTERTGTKLWFLDAARRGLSQEPLLAQLERWVSAQRAHQLLALVGLGPSRKRERPSSLSGGERARASLALLIARDPSLVLLDEPEIDLDLPMLELLEQALADGPAAVVMATHDERLARAVADGAWSLQEGRLVAHRGGVDGYLDDRRRVEATLGTAVPADADARSRQRSLAEPRESGDALRAAEEETQRLEEALMDPRALSQRERERAHGRIRVLTELRMLGYEQDQPPPAPRFSALEPPVRLDADDEGETLTVQGDLPALPRLKRVGTVAHLIVPEPDGACWLPWARRALLLGAVRLAFEAWNPVAVQTPALAEEELAAPWERWDREWWVLTRDAWLRHQRWPVAQATATADDPASDR